MRPSRAIASPSVMKTVTVDLGDRSYPIYIGQNLLDRPELLLDNIPGKRVLIVTNTTVAPLYLNRCASVLGMIASVLVRPSRSALYTIVHAQAQAP